MAIATPMYVFVYHGPLRKKTLSGSGKRHLLSLGCNLWGCNPLGLKGFLGIQSLGALTMWCTSSVSFSQRTRTPVCSDESSSSQGAGNSKSDSFDEFWKTAGKRVGSNVAGKNKGHFEEILDIHMSFNSISSGYHVSRWKRMGQVCNDTSLISFDGSWISSRTWIIDIMMLLMSWNIVLHCDVWWCFIPSHSSIIGRVRWKIPGKSKALEIS